VGGVDCRQAPHASGADRHHAAGRTGGTAIRAGARLFDTEPSFTEAEFAAWRGAVWALSKSPETTAIPALQQVVEKCFATSLIPNHAGWNYARQGYRAEDLGKAAVWALEHLPRKAGMAILADVQARAYPGDLRVLLREAIERIEGARSMYSTVRGMQ
jgi:hypothetical protein